MVNKGIIMCIGDNDTSNDQSSYQSLPLQTGAATGHWQSGKRGVPLPPLDHQSQNTPP